MFDCNPVNTPMESGTKLSKFDIGEKIGLHFVHKSRRKSEVLDMYETKYSLCGWSSKSLHGRSYLHSLEGLQKSFTLIKRYDRPWTIFFSSKDFNLVGYYDSDYTGDVNDRKSTSNVMFFLGDCVISWSSNKQ